MVEYCLTSNTNKHNAATYFIVMEMMQDHLLIHTASMPVRKHKIKGKGNVTGPVWPRAWVEV